MTKLPVLLMKIATVGAVTFAMNIACAAGYMVGVGKGDMTAVELGALSAAYVLDPPYTGLQSRNFARAFYVGDPHGPQNVLFVVAELAAPSETLKRLILRLLAESTDPKFPAFDDRNLVLMVTHTHGVSDLGNDKSPIKLNAQVKGIMKAIKSAWKTSASGNIRVMEGALAKAGANRSAQAFDLNVESDKNKFPEKIDPRMSQLVFETGSRKIGALTFYGLHPTTMIDEGFSFITSENYGYAAQRMEDDANASRKAGDAEFVAAFAQTGLGDVTPNVNFKNCNDVNPAGPFNSWRTHLLARHDWGCGRGIDPAGPFQSLKKSGDMLADAGNALLNRSADSREIDADPRDSSMAYSFERKNLANNRVDGAYTGAGQQTTCDAAWGSSFSAGSSEDVGMIFAREGTAPEFRLADVVGWIAPLLTALGVDATWVGPGLAACQFPKNVVLAIPPKDTGLQVVKLGFLTLAFTPFELTTMTQYRIRRDIGKALCAVDHDSRFCATGSAGVELNENDRVIAVSQTSNSVPSPIGSTGGYVVTPEEFDSQQYEGGYTPFGKWTQPALSQALSEMAKITQSKTPTSAPPAVNVKNEDALVAIANGSEKSLGAATAWDGIVYNWFTPYSPGSVWNQPYIVKKGKTGRRAVEAQFVSSHPMNAPTKTDAAHPDTGIFTIYTKSGNEWVPVQKDGHWGATIEWRDFGWLCINCRIATVSWDIPDGMDEKTIQITHQGWWRPFLFLALSDLRSFKQATNEFVIPKAD